MLARKRLQLRSITKITSMLTDECLFRLCEGTLRGQAGRIEPQKKRRRPYHGPILSSTPAGRDSLHGNKIERVENKGRDGWDSQRSGQAASSGNDLE